jgi:hypothetical protein
MLGAVRALPVLRMLIMNYEEVRADLDELALEMTTSAHAWSRSQRLDKLRSLAILTRRALKAASGSADELERSNNIDSLLDRIKSMVSAAEQLDQLKEDFRNRRT